MHDNKIIFFNLFVCSIFCNFFNCSSVLTIKSYPEGYPADIVITDHYIDSIVVNFHNKFVDSIKVNNSKFNHGRRSEESILKTMMPNLQYLRYEYNKRLKEIPDLFGKITVRFSILENGQVADVEKISSTLGDNILNELIVNKISAWNFDSINITSDTTTVVYPFVFSQSQNLIEHQIKDIESIKKVIIHLHS